MKTVGLDNCINGYDYKKLNYNHDDNDYDALIGKQVRGDNMMVIGIVESIDYYTDAFGHEYAVAVLNTGRRINCRVFFAKRQDYAMWSVNDDDMPFSDREDHEWKERYMKVSTIVNNIDSETLEKINICVDTLVLTYFSNFPAVRLFMKDGIATREFYPILIPITEDVLRGFDLYD